MIPTRRPNTRDTRRAALGRVAFGASAVPSRRAAATAAGSVETVTGAEDTGAGGHEGRGPEVETAACALAGTRSPAPDVARPRHRLRPPQRARTAPTSELARPRRRGTLGTAARPRRGPPPPPSAVDGRSQAWRRPRSSRPPRPSHRPTGCRARAPRSDPGGVGRAPWGMPGAAAVGARAPPGWGPPPGHGPFGPPHPPRRRTGGASAPTSSSRRCSCWSRPCWPTCSRALTSSAGAVALALSVPTVCAAALAALITRIRGNGPRIDLGLRMTAATSSSAWPAVSRAW